MLGKDLIIFAQHLKVSKIEPCDPALASIGNFTKEEENTLQTGTDKVNAIIQCGVTSAKIDSAQNVQHTVFATKS